MPGRHTKQTIAAKVVSTELARLVTKTLPDLEDTPGGGGEAIGEDRLSDEFVIEEEPRKYEISRRIEMTFW